MTIARMNTGSRLFVSSLSSVNTEADLRNPRMDETIEGKTNNYMPITTTIYARKSTDREDKQIMSIPGQLRELHALATSRGLAVACELTESCSARDPGRPIFSKLLADAEAGRVQRIVAWKLDRLARNPIDGGRLIHALGKGRLQEIVTPEATYTGTAEGKFMLALFFGIATKMTDDLAAGVRRGNEDVCREGRIPGAPPLGYLKVRDRAGFRGAGKVVPDPVRFSLLQQAWLDIASGTCTATEAWRRATAAGLVNRPTAGRPSRPLTLPHFFQVLKNRFYTGSFRHAGTLYKGEHEPMVTDTQFTAVQVAVGRADAPRPSRHSFLFQGLARCGDCGGERAMIGEAHTTTAGNRHVYYRCGRRRRGQPVCSSPPAREADLEHSLAETLRHITLAPGVAEWTRGAVDWFLEHSAGTVAAEAAAAEHALADVDTKLRKLTDYLIAGHVAEEDFAQRKEALQLERARLENERSDPKAATAAWKANISAVLDAGVRAHEIFVNGDLVARRALIAELYANVAVTNKTPLYVLKFPYLILPDAPTVHAGFREMDANAVSFEEAWQQSKKATGSGGALAACSLWCTRLMEVRTRPADVSSRPGA
jgi:DNA invertase Pin-like site-specific DNA recombinase